MAKKENWLFVFAAMGAVAAFVKILEYFGITPFKGTNGAGVQVVPIEHSYTSLIWALSLVLFSLVLSFFGFYIANRRQRDLQKQLTEKIAACQRSDEMIAEKNRTISNLEKALQLEKNTLSGCPQLVFAKTPGGRVALHNAGSVDAFQVQMVPVPGHDVQLTAKAIPHLKAGDTISIELSSERIVSRAGLSLPKTSDASVFLKERADTLPFVSFLLIVEYRDASGQRKLRSSGDVLWTIWPVNELTQVEPGKVERIP